MGYNKKEDIFVTVVILGAVLLFTLININPTFTGYTIVYYRIHGLGNMSGETLPAVEGNSAPLIYYYKPIELILTISKQENATFYIEKIDPDNDELTVNWYLNNLKIKEDTDSYTFYGKEYNTGNYNLTVIVSDGSLTDSKEWLVKLVDKSIRIGCGKCCDVVCKDSEILCPDGYFARCENSCNIKTGKCSSCEPTCVLYPTTAYLQGSYEIIKDKPAMISKRTIPCINVTAERRKIVINKVNITSFTNMPKGYSIVLSPFNIDCGKENVELTLSIPKNYIDIKALRCKGINCYPTTIEKTRSLECGGKIVKEFVEKSNYLDPELMPIKIEKVSLNFSSFKQTLRTSNNQIRFYGDVFTNLSATLSMPAQPVEEAKNPNLRIVGTPLMVKVETKNKVSSFIEMSYLLKDNIDEESIRMYVKTKEGWDYVGGKLDKEKKIVKVAIQDIQKYLNENNNETELALMGIICVNCLNSSFEKIYEPKQKSREAVLLIHGLTSTPLTYEEIINDIRLTEQPFQLWVYGYPSTRAINLSIKELADYLQTYSNEFDRMFIVGHSLGGLIAQQALYYSKNNPDKYNYLNKIKKLILVGVPNEGTPSIENYRNLFNYLINVKTKSFFNLDNPIIHQIVKGVITPKIDGINYYVIAGTKPYEFNFPLFKIKTEELLELYEKNDGIITVKSAQRVGNSYINDMCNNYWEVNLTHTELINDKNGREVIEKILSEELLSKEEQASLLGNNQYFEIKINDCSVEDKYVIIGKKIKEEEIEDPTGCSCGNGFCGVGEDRFNCPADCMPLIKNKYSVIPYIIGIIFLIICLYRFAKIDRLKYFGTKKLISYIQDNYDIVFEGGISSLELKKELKNKGFSDILFKDAFKSIYKNFFMDYLLLEEYIENKLLMNVPKKKIKEELLKKGWKTEIINKAFNKEIVHFLRFKKK